MGNDFCAQKRNSIASYKRHSQQLYKIYKKSAEEKYADLHEEAREKYEEAKFNYREKKKAEQRLTSPKKRNNMNTSMTSETSGGFDFQCILIEFEKVLPMKKVELADYERRIKKLVYESDMITIWQLIECFQDLESFADIKNSESFAIAALTSKYLRKEDQGQQSSELNGEEIGNAIDDEKVMRKANALAQQEIYIPYLMLLGILYCKATPRAKANKFYQLCQMELTPHVSNGDKQLKEFFKILLGLSTIYLVEQFDQSYIGKSFDEEAKENEMAVYQKDIIFQLKQSDIDNMFEDLYEDFLNNLFDTITRLDRQDFIDKLSLDWSKYLLPSHLRSIVVDKLEQA